MDTAERELSQLLSTFGSGVALLVSLAVLVLGLVVVRPIHMTSGLIFAGAGAARLLDVIIGFALRALWPKDGDFESMMVMSTLSTLIWLVMSAIFWGGIAFGAFQLVSAHSAKESPRGAS